MSDEQLKEKDKTDDVQDTSQAALKTEPLLKTIATLHTDTEKQLSQAFVPELKRTLVSEVLRHRVPLVVLGCLLFFPFTIPLWVLGVLVWTFVDWLYERMPEARQAKMAAMLPEKIRSSHWFRELGHGVSQVSPYILFFAYLCFAPLALIWMLVHFVLGFKEKEDQLPVSTDQKILLVQNKRKAVAEKESNFFHSPSFPITLVLTFLSGGPAAISFYLYNKLGIDTLLGMPSHDPQFTAIFVIIGLYIYSICWCLSVLFFRAWFTFPTNFLSTEQIFELNHTGVTKHPLKGWASTVMTLNRPWAGVDFIDWKDARSITYDSGSGMRLYPLPESPFGKESIIYKTLNRLAAIVDGFVDRVGRAEYIHIKAEDGSDIKLNLWELTSSERARLFYAVRNWAPHVVADDRVQEKLIGSKAMSDQRYTQIWFELLTSNQARQRTSALVAGDALHSGKYTVSERLGTGGQATVYVAQTADGNTCVLKEFVLSGADTVGAMLESAADFDNEAGLLSRLDHPGIVKLLDTFAEDQRIYLALEHVQGRSLRKIVSEDGPLGQEKVRDIALQMCDILRYLHDEEPPLVHRDISPDNIVLLPDGSIKLIDFSLATRAASKKVKPQTPGSNTTTTSFTRSGCVGKFGYTPPEQFREEVSTQSDIYGLGSTMHFLLTGKDPKPLTQSSPAGINPDISAKLDGIIRHATELNTQARFEDINWMKLELEQI